MVTAAILHPLWIRTYRITEQQDVDSVPYRGAHILTCSTCSCSNQWLLSSHYYIVMWVLSTQRSDQMHLQTCADKSVHRYTNHHLAMYKRGFPSLCICICLDDSSTFMKINKLRGLPNQHPFAKVPHQSSSGIDLQFKGFGQVGRGEQRDVV